MITAYEAMQMTNDANTIGQVIPRAARNGQTSVTLINTLEADTIKFLEDLGYTVKNGNTISWLPKPKEKPTLKVIK